MKILLKILSYTGLILTIGPPVMYFNGMVTLESNHNVMFLGTILWFITAPFWINDKMRLKTPEKS